MDNPIKIADLRVPQNFRKPRYTEVVEVACDLIFKSNFSYSKRSGLSNCARITTKDGDVVRVIRHIDNYI